MQRRVAADFQRSDNDKFRTGWLSNQLIAGAKV